MEQQHTYLLHINYNWTSLLSPVLFESITIKGKDTYYIIQGMQIKM
jgi:hypothetical protein